jgi:hypothetical protein
MASVKGSTPKVASTKAVSKKTVVKKAATKVGKKATKSKAAAAVSGIQAWQDDPMGLPPINRPVPNLNAVPLPLKINSPQPAPAIYNVGTPEFRYWTAAEALRRGADFWGAKGIKKWQIGVGAKLPVTLDEGVDLNAYYNRTELAFFHASAGGKTVYSGESPDIVCHELGHACLDAHRPQLWSAPFIEVGSFHESFGDMSAILSALQLPSVRTAALAGVASRKASDLSRCAEQLGWAIRLINSNAVDSDCLRNAFNKFNYVDPNTLPDSAPATQLCAEVHSFSRVFTGAFYDILSGMLNTVSKTPTTTHLSSVSGDAAKLLLAAIAAAPVRPNYYAQVASRMIDADTAQFNGKYREVLKSVFVKRAILSQATVNVAASVTKTTRAAIAAVTMSPVHQLETQRVVLNAKDFGLENGEFIAEAVVEHQPALSMAAAQSRSFETRPDDVTAATRRFVQMLAAHGRIATPGTHAVGIAPMADGSRPMATHQIVKRKNAMQLERIRFLCGCRVLR